MEGISAFALFCEDVRREASGKETLIGVMADVMTFPAFPARVRRIQVYFRIRFEVGKKYNQIIVPTLEWDGKPVDRDSPEPLPVEMIERSLIGAEKRKLSYATAAIRVRLDEPLPVQSPGKILAILNIGDEKMLCGALTFAERPSSLSQQPPP
jgi:hypothetical protein